MGRAEPKPERSEGERENSTSERADVQDDMEFPHAEKSARITERG